jgi:polyphenol oxidase
VISLGSLGGGVRYAFTSRAGGFSAPPYDTLNLSLDVGDAPEAVEQNRAQLLARLGVSRAVWLHAQHGATVASVGGGSLGDGTLGVGSVGSPEADAMVATSAEVALASLSADCVLVVLADPAAGVIATAHCGRQGLTAGIIAATVATLRAHGTTSIVAATGPSICGACYEVPQAMADEVSAVVPAAAARSRNGTPALDIGAGVAAQLAGCGVELVRRVGGCTREDPGLFSYRRDAVTGRQAALIWRTP